MGNVQAIPVIGEIATVAEGAGKTFAAGACAAVGQTDAASELIEGAGQTFVNYTEVNVIAANVNLAVAAICDDDDKVRHLRDRQEKAWLDLAENTPVVGHGIGVGRYIAGDTEGGNRCMIGASRSALVIGATVATGGAGGIVCGAVAASAGLGYDAAVTGINSAANGKFSPVGFVAGVDRAVHTGNANDMFDAAEIPVVDALVAARYGKAEAKAIRALAERTTPAALLEQQQRRPSVPESYKPYAEAPNSQPQVTLAELRSNSATAAMVKEFPSAGDAVRGLEGGQKYDFVRMRDGSVRAIKHADSAEVGRLLDITDRPVGHTSLVEPGASVVAAGEIHININGIWENINCQSGHFRVPLKIMNKQVGRAFPRSLLTLESPTFRILFSPGATGIPQNLRHIAMYTSSLLALVNTKESATPLASSTFILAFHENTAVQTIALGSLDYTGAKKAYEAVSIDFAKVLIEKPSNKVLLQHGQKGFVDLCIQQVRQINAVFPEGSWRETSKNIESCFDPEAKKFLMRFSCRTRDGKWVEKSIQFESGDRFENQNGELVKL